MLDIALTLCFLALALVCLSQDARLSKLDAGLGPVGRLGLWGIVLGTSIRLIAQIAQAIEACR